MENVTFIKPNGKTQSDIDVEQSAVARADQLEAARAYLADTDYQVIKAVEDLVLEYGLIDAELVEQRRAARKIVRTHADTETSR